MMWIQQQKGRDSLSHFWIWHQVFSDLPYVRNFRATHHESEADADLSIVDVADLTRIVQEKIAVSNSLTREQLLQSKKDSTLRKEWKQQQKEFNKSVDDADMELRSRVGISSAMQKATLKLQYQYNLRQR